MDEVIEILVDARNGNYAKEDVCICYSRIPKGEPMNPSYDDSIDRTGMEFDDFGECVYTNDSGQEFRLLAHKRLGLYVSYVHQYGQSPDGYKLVRFVSDNTKFDDVKRYLEGV